MRISREVKNVGVNVGIMPKKDKYLLTVSVNLRELAEFSAATDILGQRTNSAFVFQFLMQKVREAKEAVTDRQFEDAVQLKMEEIQDRSKRKALERSATERGAGTESMAVTDITDPKNPKPVQMIQSKKPTGPKLNFSGDAAPATNEEREALLKIDIAKATAAAKARWAEEDAKKKNDA